MECVEWCDEWQPVTKMENNSQKKMQKKTMNKKYFIHELRKKKKLTANYYTYVKRKKNNNYNNYNSCLEYEVNSKIQRIYGIFCSSFEFRRDWYRWKKNTQQQQQNYNEELNKVMWVKF